MITTIVLGSQKIIAQASQRISIQDIRNAQQVGSQICQLLYCQIYLSLGN
jgi:hypothetical protein